MNEAAALPPEGLPNMTETDSAIAAALAATVNGDTGIEIDEDLFAGDDIDDIDDDLDTLDLDL